MTSPNYNAPLGGAPITKLAGAGGVKGKKKKLLSCSNNHTSKLRKEIQAAMLGLRDASGASQSATLPLVLEYLGPRGLNTKEGEALGYYRIATRIQEMEARGWNIASLRESIIGADGLKHSGIARYVLLGRKADGKPEQGSLDLGGV